MKPNDYRKIQEYIDWLFDEWEIDIIWELAHRLKLYSKLSLEEKLSIEYTNTLSKTKTALETKIDTINEVIPKLTDNVVSFTLDKVNEENQALGDVDITKDNDLMQRIDLIHQQTDSALKDLNIGFATKDNRFKDIGSTYQYECAMYDSQTQGATEEQKNDALVRCVNDITDRGILSYDHDDNRCTEITPEIKRVILKNIEDITQINAEMMSILYDTDYVEVTAHYGARPTHAVWQGKVYKIHGSEPSYPNLYEATELGQGQGLKGWNCRHDYFPFIMGKSKRTYTDEELEAMLPENNKFTFNGKEYDGYTSTQRQRALERRIKKQRRTLVGLNAIGDDERFKQESFKMKSLLDEYEAFSNMAKLPMQIDRTTITEYTPNLNSRVWSVINKGI